MAAVKYLKRQPKRCVCDTCVLPDDELERARAELACTIACQKKCPPDIPQCPLKQFENEPFSEYQKRCKAAFKFAERASSAPSNGPLLNISSPGEGEGYTDEFADPEAKKIF